jgi:hypothetical protein
LNFLLEFLNLKTGAVRSVASGLYKESQGVHPHGRNATRLPLPLPDLSEALLQLDGTSTPAVRLNTSIFKK